MQSFKYECKEKKNKYCSELQQQLHPVSECASEWTNEWAIVYTIVYYYTPEWSKWYTHTLNNIVVFVFEK